MTEDARPPAAQKSVVRRFRREGPARPRTEVLATEEPFEIRLNAGGQEFKATITMRTPGNDFELAAGFLYAESVLSGKADLTRSATASPRMSSSTTWSRWTCGAPCRTPQPWTATSTRTAAAGCAGKRRWTNWRSPASRPWGKVRRSASELILSLPERLQKGQRLFARTGGVHAAGLFDAGGKLLCVREDVGRHNALDKLVGWALLDDRLPLNDHVILVSGRASFELVQKALRAGAGMLCAVSAPSTLAVDLAARFGMTLVGFLREDSFNVYTGEGRVLPVGYLECPGARRRERAGGIRSVENGTP